MTTMTTDIIELAPLLQRAVDTLNNAKTSAEILDARNIAHTVYAAAQEAEYRARVTGAAQAVITACHKAQAQALKIEAQAKIRLVNEYEAAQERGEVVGPHSGAKKRVSEENPISTLAQMGLNKEGMHEGRQLRNAEAKEPGVISKALDAEVAAGNAPKRATMTKAVKNTITGKRQNRRGVDTPKLNEAMKIVAAKLDANLPINAHRLAEEHGNISHVTFDMAISAETKARERLLNEPFIDPATLSLTSQKKLDIAFRQYERRLNAEHAKRMAAIDEEVRVRVVEEGKSYAEMLQDREKKARDTEAAYRAMYRDLTNNHKPIFSDTEYTAILRCLHADSRNSLSDERLNFAFNLFNTKKLQLTGQK